MREEKDSSGQALMDPPGESGQKKEETPSPAPRNGRGSVGIYLAVLMGAAFLLLLMAYFTQQRNNEETISGLRDSITSIESLNALIDENRELRDEAEALEEQVEGLEDELAGLGRDLEDAAARQAELAEALSNAQLDAAEKDAALYSWTRFWELEAAYLARDYDSCAALVVKITASEALTVPEGCEERMEEIENTLIRQRVLTEDYTAHLEDYAELVDAYDAAHP